MLVYKTPDKNESLSKMAAIYENGVIVREISAKILKERFLVLFGQVGSVNTTCKILGMNRQTLYNWKRDDANFLKAFNAEDEAVLNLIEDEAFRRAILGVDKPVYQGGKKAGLIKEYSDTLLIVLLKARAPQKYKERFAGELNIDPSTGRPMETKNELTINHVYSAIPLANREEDIIDIPYEVVKKMIPELPAAAQIKNAEDEIRKLQEELKRAQQSTEQPIHQAPVSSPTSTITDIQDENNEIDELLL